MDHEKALINKKETMDYAKKIFKQDEHRMFKTINTIIDIINRAYQRGLKEGKESGGSLD